MYEGTTVHATSSLMYCHKCCKCNDTIQQCQPCPRYGKPAISGVRVPSSWHCCLSPQVIKLDIIWIKQWIKMVDLPQIKDAACLAATIFKGVVEHLKEKTLHETLSFGKQW